MSLIASHICIARRLGMPIDVVNTIAQYIGTNSKWVPHFDIHGVLRWKVNPQSFGNLSEIISFKPAIVRNFRTNIRAVSANGVESNHSETVLIAPRLISPTEIDLIVYTKFETAPEVFNYAMMSFHWTFGEATNEHSFVKGTLHCPQEALSWNRQQKITSARIETDAVSIEHTDVIFQYVWNYELNIGEYVVFDAQAPPNFPPPIWVHDTEEDNIGWA